MTVYKRADSAQYWTEFHMRGHRYRFSTRTTNKREARAVEKRLRSEVRRQQDASTSVSLSDAAEWYYRQRLEPKGKPRSARKDAHLLKLILDHFGDVPVDTITTADVTAWIAALFEQGNSAGTVNRKLATLRALLNYAKVHMDALDVAPRIMSVKSEPYKERYLTEAEVQRLLDHSPSHLQRLVVFLVDTGARLSEATGLTWQDVTLTGKSPSVSFRSTKSGKARGVPLTKRVVTMLREIRPRGANGDARVFTWRRDDGVELPFDTVKSSWRRAREAAGLPWVRLHDCRHHYASRLVRAGVPILTVQKLLGHSTPVVTARYSHLRTDDLVGAVRVLDQEDAET